MTLKEKLQKYAGIQKEAIELLTKNSKDEAIAKMNEAADVFNEVVTDVETLEKTSIEKKAESGEGFSPEEVVNLKKYASLYVDGFNIAEILKDLAEAKDMITTLTKASDDQKLEIEKMKSVAGDSQQGQDDINKTGDSKRPSLRLG